MPAIVVTLEKIKNPHTKIVKYEHVKTLISFSDSFVLLKDEESTIIYDVLADTQYTVHESETQLQELLFDFTNYANKAYQAQTNTALDQILKELRLNNTYLEMLIS